MLAKYFPVNNRAMFYRLITAVLMVLVTWVCTACFRVRVTSTIPKQDLAFVPNIQYLKQRQLTANPIVVTFFGKVGNDQKPRGAIMRLDRNRRYNPQTPAEYSDANGRTVSVVPPGRYRAVGLLPGFRPAEAGMLQLTVGDSVVIHCFLQVDPMPYY